MDSEKSQDSQNQRRAPSREMLLAVHRFPCEFVIKAFGPGPTKSDFNARAVACAERVVTAARVTSSERATASGRRVCVTLNVQAERVEDVEDVYEALFELDDLLMIL